jgi:hypothetical protein
MWAEYSRRISSMIISNNNNNSKILLNHNKSITIDIYNHKVWLQQAMMQVLGEKEFWNHQFIDINDSFTSKHLAIFRYARAWPGSYFIFLDGIIEIM